MHERRRKKRLAMEAAERKSWSTVKSPTIPFIYLLREGSWAETWHKERKR
jgi:hypothetical protein